MNKGIKAIVVILVIALISFGAWKYLTRDKAAESGALLSTTKSADFQVGREIIAELNMLNSLKLDSQVFQDPVFLSLRDFTVGVFQEDLGRPNPFAPFGFSAAANSSAAKSNTR